MHRTYKCKCNHKSVEDTVVNRISDFLEYIVLLEKQTIKKVNQKTKKEFQIVIRTKKTLKSNLSLMMHGNSHTFTYSHIVLCRYHHIFLKTNLKLISLQDLEGWKA